MRQVVVEPVKVVKIQLITTVLLIVSNFACCCWTCKGSKNSANHNSPSRTSGSVDVVVEPVKVVKIQLITTSSAFVYTEVCCCWTCKGSKNSANHNDRLLHKGKRWRCCWTCKGSKNSANHNVCKSGQNVPAVVVEPVKVVKIQLITTVRLNFRALTMLLLNL